MRDVSEVTGFPEMLDGRVKTMHPKITGGILAMRAKPEHMHALPGTASSRSTWWWSISMRSRKWPRKPDANLEDLIENIDIGGPTMIRSAAKNYQDVAVVTSPDDYAAILEELRASRRRAFARNELAAGAEGVPHHGRLRPRHQRAPGSIGRPEALPATSISARPS